MARKLPRRPTAARTTKAQIAAAKRQLRAAEKRLRMLEREQAKQRRRNKKYKAKGLSYAKRLVRGLRLGKTRQQSRGHRPREHVTRAQNAQAEGRLTSAQKQRIARFAKTQSKRENSDYTNMREAMLSFAEQDGFEKISEIMTEQRNLARSYKRSDHQAIFTGMSNFEERFPDVPDISWMYYH